MTIQTWVLKNLNEGPHSASAIGNSGVRVARQGSRDVIAICPEPGGTPFTSADLESALKEVPGSKALIVTRRPLAPGVFEEAIDRGLLVTTFGHFERALQLDDITTFEHPDEIYIMKRLRRDINVAGITKIGLKAWRIQRTSGLRSLTIVSHDRYEFTDDEMWQLVGQYPGVGADAFVITNPNSGGFGSRVAQSATGLGITLCTLNEFIHRLHESWN